MSLSLPWHLIQKPGTCSNLLRQRRSPSTHDRVPGPSIKPCQSDDSRRRRLAPDPQRRPGRIGEEVVRLLPLSDTTDRVARMINHPRVLGVVRSNSLAATGSSRPSPSPATRSTALARCLTRCSMQRRASLALKPKAKTPAPCAGYRRFHVPGRKGCLEYR